MHYYLHIIHRPAKVKLMYLTRRNWTRRNRSDTLNQWKTIVIQNTNITRNRISYRDVLNENRLHCRCVFRQMSNDDMTRRGEFPILVPVPKRESREHLTGIWYLVMFKGVCRLEICEAKRSIYMISMYSFDPKYSHPKS